MTTRRQFLELAAKSAAGLTLTAIVGCEMFGTDGTLADSPYQFLTPTDAWYWFSYAGLEPHQSPRIAARDWALDVRSGGRSVATIDYDTLKSHEFDGHAVTYIKTLRSIRGSFVAELTATRTATGVFRGIPLRRVLENTSISGEALKLRFAAADGFTSSILYSRLLNEELLPVILAFELNGRPIPPARGGPVRLISPEMWGFKSMKWITTVDATTDASSFGYFETEGGATGPIDAPGLMPLSTLVQNPTTIRADVGDSIELHGMALVGGSSIAAVEVIIDDGPPELATLATAEDVIASLGHDALLVRSSAQYGTDWPYRDVWVPWSHRIQLSRGRRKVVVRSVDATGKTNPSFTETPHITAQHIELDLFVA